MRSGRSLLWKLEFQDLPANQPLKRGELRLLDRQQVRCLDLLVEIAGLCLGDPDADQVAADVVPPGEVQPRSGRWRLSQRHAAWLMISAGKRCQ